MAGPASPVRCVVIGGGVAGLAAAHRLVELAPARGIPLDLTLIEARPRCGGTIGTERDGGYLVEHGPDAFLTEKPWALDLCRRIGLSERLIGMNPTHRRAFVVSGGRLHPLPEGFLLLAPTKFGTVLWSPLFSWRGKARMAMELFLPPRRASGDESLAGFVTRRLGREVLEKVAQPMIAGIYTADPTTLSLAATMPRFLEMERTHGSVIRGTWRARANRSGNGGDSGREGGGGAHGSGATGRGERGGGAGDSGARSDMFAVPDDGMGTLIDALERGVRAARLSQIPAIRTATRAMSLAATLSLTPAASSLPGARYRIGLDDGAILEADAVIVATESHQATRLLAGIDTGLAGALAAIPYASSATVTLGYRREQIAHPLDGFGFVVPHVEGRSVLACTFSSVKFAGRAPEGAVLLRAFLGGALQPEVLDLDDQALASLVERELARLLGISGTAHLRRVHRHPRAMPQYLVGHLDRVAAIEEMAARHPGLALAGAAYRGVGIPDCIKDGSDTAVHIVRYLTERRT